MHHTFDASAGMVLLIERIIVSIVFLVAVIYTSTQSRLRVRKFLFYFGILGCLYMCSTPLVVGVAEFISRKDRN